MGYTVKSWRITAAQLVTNEQDHRPSCVGDFLRNPGNCMRRPPHVVSWTQNTSGLPGIGQPAVHAACHLHLHGLVQHAQKVTKGGPVTISAYDGV